MSTGISQPETDGEANNTEKPARPSGKPSIQTEKITENALERLPNDVADGARAVRDSAPSHRAVFAALVDEPDAALSTTEIGHKIFYTQGGVYAAGKGDLVDAGLMEMDEESSPTTFFATDLGVKVADHLRKMLDVDLRKLLVDYYADPEPDQQASADEPDTDADTDEDDENAELFSCTIGDCDFAHERRKVVEDHISNGVDGGHGGRSGTEAGIISPPSAMSDNKPDEKPTDPIARLNQAMGRTDDDDDDDDESTRSSTSSSSSSSSKSTGAGASEDTTHKRKSSGSWQTWDERPAASWNDVDDTDVDVGALEDVAEMLRNEIGKMSQRVEKDKMSNLTREDVRCGQLSSLAQGAEALVAIERARADLGAQDDD